MSKNKPPRQIVIKTSTYFKKSALTGFVSRSFTARIVEPKRITMSIRSQPYFRKDLVTDLITAGQNLIDDVKNRYPGEELECPYMIKLDDALKGLKV